MRRGYLTPPVVIALALITLFVAATIYAHKFLISDVKKEPAVNSSPSIQSSPPSSADETIHTDASGSVYTDASGSVYTDAGSVYSDIGTANWKTYTNKEFNYEVQYPANWYEAGPYGGQAGYDCLENPQNVTIIEFSQTKLADCGFTGEQLPPVEADVTIWVLNKPFTADEIPTKNELGENVSKKITMVGEEATKIPFTEKTALPNIQATRIYFNHTGRSYLIFLKQTDKKGNYDPIYDQILSTFKFLE